jgi:hypothetical protein
MLVVAKLTYCSTVGEYSSSDTNSICSWLTLVGLLVEVLIYSDIIQYLQAEYQLQHCTRQLTLYSQITQSSGDT